MFVKLFWTSIEIISISLSVILPLLLVIAFFTLLERKVMASLQRRIGPNIHGYYGALQPLIDGLKLLWKEMLVPAKANFYIFIFSPMFMMSLSFSLWAILPLSFTFTTFDSKLSLVTFFVISSINVYNIILAGWSSNSKYAFLGSVRAMGQMFSYELVLGFVLIFMLLTVGSLRIYDIVIKQYYVGHLFWPLLPFAVIFFISLLMETNRAPFDLSEAESELVAGYNVEYSSIMFAMFFLGEYCNILAMSSIWSILFWGGFISNYFGVGVFIMKILTLSFMFIFIRSMLPRYRIDQLIYVGWHVMLPVALGLCVFMVFVAAVFNVLPQNSATYLTSTVPENSDFDSLYYTNDDKWFEVFRTQGKHHQETFNKRLLHSIITDQRGDYVDTSLIYFILVAQEFTSDVDFIKYMVMRHFKLMYGEPWHAAERQQIINDLAVIRWRFNLVRFFSEWLTTEVGRLPYGWSERKYDAFMTGKHLVSMYDFITLGPDGMVRNAAEVHNNYPIYLQQIEDMYVANRFQLPTLLKEHRSLIAPSKYALLSEAAKAKLDLDSPVNSIRDKSKIMWINEYSDILDKNYCNERPKFSSIKDPFKAGVLERQDNFPITMAEFNAAYAEKLRQYGQKMDLSLLFTPEQIREQPKFCCDTIAAKKMLARIKEPVVTIPVTKEAAAGGTCALYSSNDDLTDFPYWGTKRYKEFLESQKEWSKK